jgi:hypothetical protein
MSRLDWKTRVTFEDLNFWTLISIVLICAAIALAFATSCLIMGVTVVLVQEISLDLKGAGVSIISPASSPSRSFPRECLRETATGMDRGAVL